MTVQEVNVVFDNQLCRYAVKAIVAGFVLVRRLFFKAFRSLPDCGCHMTSMLKIKTLKCPVFQMVVVAASLLMVACGGGSNSGRPDVIIAQLSPSYSAQFEELDAYDAFNTARIGCGFGRLKKNPHLEIAALNHLVWEVKNNTYQHSETLGTVAYTGTTHWDRMLAAGFIQGSGSFQSGEVIDMAASIQSGFGLAGARNLLSAPYHLRLLMLGYSQIGLSVKTGGPVGSGADIEFAGSSSTTHMVVNLVANSEHPAQSQASADVLTYPCAGVVGTKTTLFGELPSPIPNRNFLTNPVGMSVYIQALAGQILVITSSSIVKTSDSSPVPLAVTMTNANDPNIRLTPSQAFLIPDAPLADNTQYTVVIQGTNNGALFLKNFTFTTGT